MWENTACELCGNEGEFLPLHFNQLTFFLCKTCQDKKKEVIWKVITKGFLIDGPTLSERDIPQMLMVNMHDETLKYLRNYKL